MSNAKYPCDFIRRLSNMEGVCGRPQMYCGQDSAAGIVDFFDNEEKRGGGVRCRPRRWHEFKEACLVGRDLSNMKAAELLVIWKKWLDDQYGSDDYWRVVEQCLEEFHGQKFDGGLRARVEDMEHEEAMMFYHGEPWNIACAIAGNELDVLDHHRRYIEIRDGQAGLDYLDSVQKNV